MLRVMHILKATRIAGAETHVLTLLQGLRHHQLDAQFILLVEPRQPMDDYVALLAEHQIPVYRMIIRSDADPTLLYRLYRVLRLAKPRIMHTHLLHGDLYGTLAARWAGVPLIVTSRHNDNAFRRREPIRRLHQTLWQMADAGVAISESIARFVIDVEGAPPPKIQVIRYGLDWQITPDCAPARSAARAQLQIDPDTPLAGIACRLVPQKGVTYALQAFAQVVQDIPDARLLIAGDGPLRAELEAEAQALNIQDQVTFLGWRDDVRTVLSALDVLLAPSLWEGFGLVLLEAMAQQVPVVASAVSAIPEIVVNGETGFLVRPQAVDELALATRTLLRDTVLRRYMGLLAQDRVEELFMAQRMVHQTIELYRKLL